MGDGKRLSWLERLMFRGVRGELIQQPWFQSMREQSPTQFLIASCVGAFLLIMMLQFISGGTSIGSFVFDVVDDAITIVLAYLCLALGTKLAHRLLFWGMVGSAVGSLIGAMLVVPVLLVFIGVEQTVLGAGGAPYVAFAAALLVYCLVMAVVYTYLAVLVHRGIKRLAGPK
jgi:hypothetical protein